MRVKRYFKYTLECILDDANLRCVDTNDAHLHAYAFSRRTASATRAVSDEAPELMKLWEVEASLAELESFDPEVAQVQLEQYSTSAHLAAHVVHTAATNFGDVKDKCVLDLGCGAGMLSVACALLGARRIVAIDIDANALAAASRNLEDIHQVDLMLADARALPLAKKCFDTCIMNPPFGTRVKGIDVDFVKAAIRHTTRAVFSMHKSSTRAHLLRRARDFGALGGARVVAQLKFDIPKLYNFQTCDSVDIAVDLIRFDVDGSTIPAPEPLRTGKIENKDRSRAARGSGQRESGDISGARRGGTRKGRRKS